MATLSEEVQERLNQILLEKATKMTPDNIRKGVILFGIEGQMEKKEDLDKVLTSQDKKLLEQQQIIDKLLELIRTKFWAGAYIYETESALQEGISNHKENDIAIIYDGESFGGAFKFNGTNWVQIS